MATNVVEESSKVVKAVIDSGAFDAIRKKVLEELKASEALKAYVQEQVGSSKTLNSDSARASRDRKKVLDDLQKELQDKLVERASRLVWELLSTPGGAIATDVEAKVLEVLWRMHEEKQEKAAAQQLLLQQQQQAQQQQAQQAASASGRLAAAPPTGGPQLYGVQPPAPPPPQPPPPPPQQQQQGGRPGGPAQRGQYGQQYPNR